MKLTLERFIIIALLILIAFFAIRGCTNQKEKAIEYKDVVVERSDSLQHYEDALGREHAKRMEVEGNSETISAFYQVEKDSFLKVLDIQDKQLTSFAMVGIETHGSVRPTIEKFVHDSVTDYRFSYKDHWIDLHGVVSNDPVLDYDVYDSLIYTTYWKRKWLFGKKTTYVDAYSLNPSSHISGMQGIRITDEKAKRFGVGPYVGYGYDGQAWKPSVGISLFYSLVQF